MKTVSDFLKVYSHTLATHEAQRARMVKHTLPIVISREIGSGASLIAEGLATRLNFQVCDRQIIEAIAAYSKVPPDLVEMMDEKPGHALDMFGASLLRGASLNREEFDRYLKLTIRSLLDLGSVIILGHGGVFLAEPGKAFRLRIVAPVGVRIKNLMERFELTEKQAQEMIRNVDAARQTFYKRLFGRSEAQDDSFDLAINTERLNIDHALHLALYAYNRLAREAMSQATSADSKA